jgi:hypothetical protein
MPAKHDAAYNTRCAASAQKKAVFWIDSEDDSGSGESESFLEHAMQAAKERKAVNRKVAKAAAESKETGRASGEFRSGQRRAGPR